MRRGLRNAQIKQDYDMKTKPKDITMALTTKVRTLDLASFVIIYLSETCWLVKRTSYKNNDNLRKYVVQRDAYKTSMLCLEPKLTPNLDVCMA